MKPFLELKNLSNDYFAQLQMGTLNIQTIKGVKIQLVIPA